MINYEEIADAMYLTYEQAQSPLCHLFSDFSPIIKKLDTVRLVGQIVLEEDPRFTEAVFLSVPDIWLKWCRKDWKCLMSSILNRPTQYREASETSRFSDIELLTKYLGINGLEEFCLDKDYSISDKLAILKYFRIFSSDLYLDDCDLEFLISEGLVSPYDLEKVKLSLLSEGMIEFNIEYSEVKDYIFSLQKALGE